MAAPLIAALFVDPFGVYSQRENVDTWGMNRDARNYAGSDPVVAHPPCQLWVNLAGVNFIRYTKPQNRPGNDKGCFCSALENVRRCGGVLEHPAGSLAWDTFCLQKPSNAGWTTTAFYGGSAWVCEVWQSAYGHRARKRTWLYYVGKQAPLELLWSREPGSHQVGWFDRKRPTLSKREASATPEAFCAKLISLAKQGRLLA